ncbi:MAG: iron-containing alcohol dehydrogenase [Pseudomonadales bacterium]
MQEVVFQTVKHIVCRPGATEDLPALCLQLAAQRILLITDPGLCAIGLVAPVVSRLEAAGFVVSVFGQVREDPPESVVLEAVEAAYIIEAQLILGFGGGSSMDVAKVVSVLANSDQELVDIYGVDQIAGERLPLILVPTTAGTGSEVTPVAVLTTGETTKAGISSTKLLPDVALLDAQLTLGLPPAMTAMTGIDAMVHAIEAYTSRHRKNAYSDMAAREALICLSRNILTAVHQGDKLEARSQMAFGSMLAGQAFANAPVAAVHALAYPIGGRFHIPHGLSNSLVLPSVLRFNASHAYKEYAELADLLKLGGDTAAHKTDKLIAYLVQLISDVELPATLSQVDIPFSSLEQLATDAMDQQRLLINNPREVHYADALAIYNAAY